MIDDRLDSVNTLIPDLFDFKWLLDRFLCRVRIPVAEFTLTFRDLFVGDEVATSASRFVPPDTSLLRFIITLEASSSATSSVSTSVSSVITGGLLTVGDKG